MSRFINNYVKAKRLRAGLTQDDLAFLLGCHSGSKVSRYEHLDREPNLETALACQAVFGVPVAELFPGSYTLVERKVKRRATVLSSQLEGRSELSQEVIEQFLISLREGLRPNVRQQLWETPKQHRLF